MAVQVSDNGTPALSDTALITVNVSNVHDQAPTLANMQTTINDGEVVGEWVIQMSAIDQDVVNGDTLTYSITGGNTGGAFSIDSNTGRVSTATTLDSTVTPSYSLIITVTDSVGLTDTGTLTVAVTESKHSILAALWKFDSTVPVTGGVKDVIGDVAGKFEGGAVLSNDAQGRTGVAGDKALNLGSGNGCVDVADVVFLQRLSADDMMTISFWQKVNTAGLDSSSFYAYSPSSSGNMRGIQAHTPWSNGRIYLDMRGNGSANRMDVAEPSGINWTQWCHVAFVKKGGTAEIWVNGAKLGDSSGKSALATDYTKLILGADSITSGSVNGYLDDFAFFKTALDASQISALASGVTPLLISPPVINDVTFSVNENVAIGASVDIVTATDPDADDTKVYSITGGNTGNAFTINSASGALTTAALLNHEEIGSYTLTIKVTDSAGLSDTATVTVDVADLDESSFTGVQAWEDNVQNRSEFHSKRSAVLAGNTTTTVDLTGISGDATFEFIVDAEDLAQTDLSILEGNGWSLRFEQWNNLNQLGVTRIGLTDFTLTAQAGQTVASPYGSVHQLVYVVDSVNNVTRVYLDSVLVGTLSQQPNFAASSITLGNANLRDDANAGLHAFAAYNSALGVAEIAGLKNAWFGIAPVANDATFSIAQTSASGSAVGTVSATDPGDTLSYAITAGNTGNVFEINSSTGAITTSVALNSAIEISYTLTVAVTDNGGLVDTATITVNVSNYQSWATHYELTVAEAALSADPNGDGKPNSFHYAFDTNPKSLTSDTQKLRTTVSEISGSDYLTITLPVRVGATFSGAPLTSAAIDGITYTIEADADMVSPWNLTVVEVTPALDSGLPVLSDRDGNGAADWVYRSFRVGGDLGANNKAFIRASVGIVE